jgi:MerR family transcriptional regulator, copper efflux regulator
LRTRDEPLTRAGSVPIGGVASRLRLSLRTLRYWDEVGLVSPTERTGGGSRLYSKGDLDRLAFVRAMKPIDFTIEELKDLLSTHDALTAGSADATVRESGARYAARIRDRCEILEARIVDARAASVDLELLSSRPDEAPVELKGAE